VTRWYVGFDAVKRGMLTLLNKQWRHRAASLLVVMYALCVVSPAAAFAFGNSATAAHCLTDDNHGLAKAHIHQDGISHEHSDAGNDGDGYPAKCCGLVCLSGITPTIDTTLGQVISASAVPLIVEEGILGRGPICLDRPPEFLLSF
jgi:hypothetical protein